MKKIIITAALIAMAAVTAYAQETVSAEPEPAEVTQEAVVDELATPVDTAQEAGAEVTAEPVQAQTDAVEEASAAATAADVAATAATVATLKPPVPVTRDIGNKTMRDVYLLSLRPEFAVAIGEINSVGLIAEAGMVGVNGFFFTVDLCGGIHYAGGGLNIGYAFAGEGSVKNAVGYSFGYYHTDIVTKFESESGDLLKRYVGRNSGITGLFWKINLGKESHLDVTNRFMFGYKNNSVRYNEDDGIYTEKGFTTSYSVSAGYTFMRRK